VSAGEELWHDTWHEVESAKFDGAGQRREALHRVGEHSKVLDYCLAMCRLQQRCFNPRSQDWAAAGMKIIGMTAAMTAKVPVDMPTSTARTATALR
jgi:hypothetical protein